MMQTTDLFNSFSIEDQAILDLKRIHVISYFDSKDPEVVIKFTRSNAVDYDYIPGVVWNARLYNRKGNILKTKNVTAMFVSDFLNEHREHVEITYRS
jgi:hypothetical protein